MKALRWWWWLLVLIVAAVSLFVLSRPAAAQDHAFMPKGGRTLLIEMVGAPANEDELRKIAASKRSEAQWRVYLGAQKTQKALSEREAATLAAYLAVNMPLADVKRADLTAALPPDGRDLAWNGCQSCHSLFTSHLTQDRDAQAWRNMFESPFHRGLRMSPREREEFARYSALNMPMKIEDVPSDLRF